MRDYHQETDSEVIFALPYELGTCSQITPASEPCFPSEKYEVKGEQFPISPFPVQTVNETIGGSLNIRFLLPEDPSLIRWAWNTIQQTKSQEVAKEARRLLSIIRGTTVFFKQIGIELDYLPPLRAFNVDDGSVLIEWIFRDFRIGFNVEPSLEDSGWYLVSNRNLGEISASGYTSSMDIKALVLWLLSFALSNT